ncbi:hypothetical protein GCM10023083_61140 [Streptomyces phyllanthi]
MVRTAVKNQPSNRASFDCTARTQRSMSVCIPFRMDPGSGTGRAPGWRESDIKVRGPAVSGRAMKGRGAVTWCGSAAWA